MNRLRERISDLLHALRCAYKAARWTYHNTRWRQARRRSLPDGPF